MIYSSILQEHKGYGTSNGEFRKQRYFNCPDDCGVFVSLDKLTLREDSSEQKKSSHSKLSMTSNGIINKVMDMIFPKCEKNGKQISSKQLLSVMSRYIGQRVVTFKDEKPVRGVLRAVFTSEKSLSMAGIQLV